MPLDFLSLPATSIDQLQVARRAIAVVLLALLWCWETWQPFFGHREGRLRHAGRNLAIAILNSVVTGLAFGIATEGVAAWAEHRQIGLLHAIGLTGPGKLVLALVLIDGWMYAWHRANHVIPFLWRFHRMHHSDPFMDVTTATRFHLGEQVASSVLRLGLIPVLGLDVWSLVAYDTLMIAVIQLHHADISIGRWDRWLGWLIVTPNMHKVHHSDWRPETDSNYSTVLPVWDRIFGTYRIRPSPNEIAFGIKGYADPAWQTLVGMLKTPFKEVEIQAAAPGGELAGPPLAECGIENPE